MNVEAFRKDGEEGDLQGIMDALGREARAAAQALAVTPATARDTALRQAAAALRRRVGEVLEANAKDVDAARARGMSEALLDRLRLTEARIEGMAAGLEAIAELPDPLGRSLAEWTRPNGLAIERVSVPIGVAAVIYESRPNVTADAAGLCIKSGNAAILRGGSESFHSASAILDCLREGLVAANLPEASVQRVPTVNRDAVGLLLAMDRYVDVVVPRGGKGLIERVRAESRVPVLAHLDGINHTYVRADSDPEMARAVLLNAKMRRPGVCGATETLLIDRDALATHLPAIVEALIDAGCELRGDETVRANDSRIAAATEADWDTEYLAPILAIRAVESLDAAIAHVNRHNSGHTEAILTADAAAAKRFTDEVDAAILMVNASTQFADGGEFGMGAEIGIATGKLPPRGPVGAAELTSYKYIVRGEGQCRP